MADIRDENDDSAGSLFQRCSFWSLTTSMNLLAGEKKNPIERALMSQISWYLPALAGHYWQRQIWAGIYLIEPLPMPATSFSSKSMWCMHVYKLPLKALDSIPPDRVLGVSMLFGSEFNFAVCKKFVDASEYAAISFPVWPFHTWIVPSQEATLPLTDNTQTAFTTYTT